MPIWSRPELLAKSDEWFIQRQVQCHFVALFPTVLGSFEVYLGESNVILRSLPHVL
jgi:hypothetical protein